MNSTYRDSGVFLYTGWRILNGGLPYRDIWDHKPPVIFYINALGLAIANNSRWGVWLIEFVALFLAAYIGFRLIKKSLGPYSAIFSLLLWLLTLVFTIEGGNLTTEYTLPLQFAALLLVYDANKSDFPNWRWFLIGLIGGIAFFTKQTTIGIWIAIILYLTFQRLQFHQVKRWISELLFIIAGGLTICIGWVIFFGLHHALPQFWSAAFEFNYYYLIVNTNRLKPLLDGLAPLLKVGLLQFSMMGYVAGIILIFFKKSIIKDWSPLLLVGLIDLPIELLLISTSGKIFAQYYMTLLPSLAIFAGLMFWVFLSALSSWGIGNTAKKIFITSIVGIFLWTSYAPYINQANSYQSGWDEPAIKYVESVTSPDDQVLLWGNETSVNYFTKRRSPTRFVYQYPLYINGYVNEQMIMEFLRDIINNHPRLIIDTKTPGQPIFDFPIHTKVIEASIANLKYHYRFVENVGDWSVYEYVER